MKRQTTTYRPAWRNEWLSILVAVAGMTAFSVAYELTALIVAQLETFGLGTGTSRLVFRGVKWGGLWLSGVMVCGVLVRHYRDRYVLDGDGVEHVRGIIGREVRPLQYSRITFVTKKQTLLQKLFGVGSLHLFSSGTDQAEVVIEGIRHPRRMLEAIQQHMKAAPVYSAQRHNRARDLA